MNPIKEKLIELNPEALFADGFDDALIGIGERCGQPYLAVYDYDKCIDVIMRDEGLSEEDAIEHMSFNVAGAWMGENTPIWMSRVSEDMLD